MNLTLKQLFKFGAVCVSACALSASATDFVSDSFEAPNGSLDLPVGDYKVTYEGAQNQITNLAWVAQSGDASTLVLTNAAYADINGEGPISNETSSLILNLETEGNTLSRAVTNVLDISAAPVYVDTLIQFTPSEDEPVIDTVDVKVALYVNAQSNLVVVHKVYDAEIENSWQTNSVIDSITIDPSAWYRLSIKVDGFLGDQLESVKIYLDGNLLTHANAYDDNFVLGAGSNFLNIQADKDINYISFQGTGSLDELVVSDEMPIFTSTPVAIMLTLVANDANVSFDPAGPVESGTEVTITAADWYRIASVTGPVNEDLSGAVAQPSFVVTLTAAASCSVTATSAQVSGTLPIGALELDLDLLSTWAMAQDPVLGEGDIDETNIDDYLLNVDAGTDATIEITSIVIDEVAGTTTITVAASTAAVDFTDINGTLTVYTTDDLAVDFVELASVTVTITPAALQATIVIEEVADQFLKAVVE